MIIGILIGAVIFTPVGFMACAIWVTGKWADEKIKNEVD